MALLHLLSVTSLFLLILSLLTLSPPTPTSALQLASVISSSMVLQRAPQRSRIFGTASPNSTVTLTLDTSPPSYSIADAYGHWSLLLPPHPASLDHTLTIQGDSTTLTLTDIAFGDVYLCSGQSNMDMTLNDSYTGPEAIADSIHYPLMRLFSAAKVASFFPLVNTTNRWPDGTSWVRPEPKYLNGPTFVYYSAVCWFYGRSLYHTLNPPNTTQPIPLGLMLAAWGGTVIEAWTSQPALDECGPVKWPAYNASAVEPLGPLNATGLYNGMIAPLTPVALAAVVFFQGESNVDDPVTYSCRFPAMIR